MEIYSEYHDYVINSKVLLGDITYDEALDKLYPLINRFEAQRKVLDSKFYTRLERDILKGCMIPPITIAFVSDNPSEISNFFDYIMNNISNGYILDGIQRLNTLYRASSQENYDGDRKMLLNIIISSSKDMLLYRMITLNNGQKQMSPRHQIEILTQELFDFSDLNIEIQSEKEKSENTIKGAFSLGDISRGYLAFLTNNVHNENTKIIGEKMDQILVGRILDSQITNIKFEFKDVLKLVDRLAINNDNIKQWFKTTNNFIGFCVGIKTSFDSLSNESIENFSDQIDKFEEAFSSINPSKVNLGKFRRDLSKSFIEDYESIKTMDSDDLLDRFADLTF